jgi:hypothetical protein
VLDLGFFLFGGPGTSLLGHVQRACWGGSYQSRCKGRTASLWGWGTSHTQLPRPELPAAAGTGWEGLEVGWWWCKVVGHSEFTWERSVGFTFRRPSFSCPPNVTQPEYLFNRVPPKLHYLIIQLTRIHNSQIISLIITRNSKFPEFPVQSQEQIIIGLETDYLRKRVRTMRVHMKITT